MNRNSEVAIKVDRARRLLQEISDNFYYGPAGYDIKPEEISQAKAILTEAELLLHSPKSNSDIAPPLQQAGVSLSLPKSEDEDNYDVDQAFAFMNEP